MRLSWKPIVLPLLLTACAAPTYVVATADDAAVSVDQCADELARADVVVLGEQHGVPAVHELHHALLQRLYERRPNLVIAMEMFERDVQAVMMQYLTGVIDESGFLARSRPWKNYERDYRPVVELARANALVVLAANAPRPLARKAAQEGVAVVLGDPHVARETTAPADDYQDACLEAMKGHPGSTPESLQREYAAQCLKDDTMAETVTDYLRKRHAVGDRPLLVLFCGQMHADHRRGTVARIQSRMPELEVRVLSVEMVADPSSVRYSSPRTIADYVVVTPRVEREAPMPMPAPETAPEPVAAAPAPAPAAPQAGAAPKEPAMPPADEGAPRPGLGLRPDYEAGDDGIRVASVTPGGPAETAGIEAGDVILEIGGTRVADMQQYMDALAPHAVGKTIPVRVRREAAEVVLQVKLGVRNR